MNEKRYQVFISSTFIDLTVERRAVQDVVISTGDFPVQMESFPAADEDQFQFIKTLIDQCDYYILIIAGRYGTVADDGISYTHKEFRYAASKGIPILVMLHGEPGRIEADKTEDTASGKKRLKDLIAEAEKGRLRKTWKSVEGLKLAVREALDNAKATKPRVGWVRGDSVASLDALEELHRVRKENKAFKEALGRLEIDVPLPEIPEANDVVGLDLMPVTNSGGYGHSPSAGSYAKIECSWISAFTAFHGNLKWGVNDWNDQYFYHVDDDESCIAIGSALAGEFSGIDTSGKFKISKTNLDRLMSYYIEVGLVTTEGDEPFTPAAQKIARRHRIAGSSQASFTLISGKIEVSGISSSSNEMNDEIPF
ncbi:MULTISPECIES: DUF4062 domain-containing protein [Paracoccaceae]|uniref:DUF4062 domain-containing protein n=1 Tax=Paracoccaceae TaxID=31989 RepID=UPI00329A0099